MRICGVSAGESDWDGQCENGLDADVERGHVERLEEYLRGMVAVVRRIQWRLSEQDGVLSVSISSCRERTHLLAQRAELLGVDVRPDALHVVPVGDDAVGHRIADLRRIRPACLR